MTNTTTTMVQPTSTQRALLPLHFIFSSKMRWWTTGIVCCCLVGTESFIIPIPLIHHRIPLLSLSSYHNKPIRHIGISVLSTSNQQQSTIEDEKQITTTKQKRRTWDESYQLLVSYKEKYGHCNVPHQYKIDSRLGWWVKNQRRTKASLSDERIAKLDAIGFRWSNKINEERWEEMFERLKEYKETYQNCNVPRKYKDDPRLGEWVATQRQRKDNLTDDRRMKLDGLDFSWSNEINNKLWEEMFDKLKEYNQTYGNCNVPSKYEQDPRLGSWVSQQRAKRENLSNERIAKLDALDFSWVNEINEARWDEMYQLLELYNKTYGNCNVPNNYEQDPRLGNWVITQRRKHKVGTLRKDRKEWLDEIGFTWSFQDAQWRENYEQLKRFKETHGHLRLPNNSILARWAYDQLVLFASDKMEDEKQAMLNDLYDLYFQWDYDSDYSST